MSGLANTTSYTAIKERGIRVYACKQFDVVNHPLFSPPKGNQNHEEFPRGGDWWEALVPEGGGGGG